MNKLREARNLLSTNWCEGDLKVDGKYCSAGAIGEVNGINLKKPLIMLHIL